jgi:hypothetical protein
MPCSCPMFWIDMNVTALIFCIFGYISNSFEQLEDNVALNFYIIARVSQKISLYDI